MRVPRVLLTLGLTAGSPGIASAQTADSAPQFQRSEMMIPMRDGVRLHTLVFTPARGNDSLPILLTRTPYGIKESEQRLTGAYVELARDGYVFAFQDIRGRYGSEGTFLMNRPLHDPSDSAGVDEATDTYDTVEWLIHNVGRTTGRVGVLGISYPGWLAAMAGVNAHPAVKAISPQAPMTDTWMGDDFFHYGAFRLSYGFEYASEMELTKDGSQPPPVGGYDTYDWYLEQGPLSKLTRLLAGRAPTWTNFTIHPTYDTFWRAHALPTYLKRLTVPTLTVGGWWDQEDFYGPLKTYATLEPLDSGQMNALVVGPWNHGGWSRGDGQKLGEIDFGSPTGRWFREQVQAPWFAHWLKGRDSLPVREAMVFEGGSNRWRTFGRWPPPSRDRNLYFRENGRLSFDAPTARDPAFDSYVSDPRHPVPYRQRPVQRTYDPRGSGWYTWLTEDQRFVDNRPDVLTWRTEPLTSDVVIAGSLAAQLFAATTGTDADWIVKLIDVYPDSVPGNPKMGGYELMVASEILRGRYRTGFDRPTAIRAGRIESYTVDLHQQSYRFLQGHRIMVQVQSTWFPVYDRNPQTFVPNIFTARPKDFRAATQRMYRSVSHPSHIALPVLEE
ncbi:MAG TPA: CocE/NonD family hydrolase [Gemmatimonadales bacterium]|nr:CocE/NonD family hydrolase [Gemmatimonadales bacterium]